MEFYGNHAADRERFEILAFHDGSVKSFEELDGKLAPIVRDAWGGKSLPFPILLDATGKTIREFGISAFPTVILIDPEGRLVQGGSERMLAVRLLESRPEVAAAAARLAKCSTVASFRRELGALRSAGGLEEIHALGNYLRECRDDLRAAEALAALAAIGGEAAHEIVRAEGLDSDDPKRQRSAVEALGDRKDSDAAAWLLYVLRQGTASPETRVAACKALPACGPNAEAAREVLGVVVERDPDPVRAAARKALAALK